MLGVNGPSTGKRLASLCGDAITIGIIHILVQAPPGWAKYASFHLDSRMLTARIEGNNAHWTELQAYGTRSADLLAAVGRLEATRRLVVQARPALLPTVSPPAHGGCYSPHGGRSERRPPSASTAPAGLSAGAPPDPDAADLTAAGPPTASLYPSVTAPATSVTHASPAAPPLDTLAHVLLPGIALPDGVALVELVLQLPLEFWQRDDWAVRTWLGRERRAVMTVLGAIVPAEVAPFQDDVIGGHSDGTESGHAYCAPGLQYSPSGSGAGAYLAHVSEAVGELLEVQSPGGNRERYSLISCFQDLPSITQSATTAPVATAPCYQPHCHPPPPSHVPIQPGHPCPPRDILHNPPSSSRPPFPPPPLRSSGPSAPGACPMLDLPNDLLAAVLCRLSPLDLARLAACCTRLAEVVGTEGGAVPGVTALTLFPHQRAALSWMVLRERGRPAAWQHRLTATHCGNTSVPSSPVPPWRHPTLMRLRTGALSLWADVCGGELYLGEPPGSGDVRGGFFCDEPGLGKTITALSLVLKTLGQLPEPPPGSAVTWLRNRAGQRVAFYTAGDVGGLAPDSRERRAAEGNVVEGLSGAVGGGGVEDEIGGLRATDANGHGNPWVTRSLGDGGGALTSLPPSMTPPELALSNVGEIKVEAATEGTTRTTRRRPVRTDLALVALSNSAFRWSAPHGQRNQQKKKQKQALGEDKEQEEQRSQRMQRTRPSSSGSKVGDPRVSGAGKCCTGGRRGDVMTPPSSPPLRRSTRMCPGSRGVDTLQQQQHQELARQRDGDCFKGEPCAHQPLEMQAEQMRPRNPDDVMHLKKQSPPCPTTNASPSTLPRVPICREPTCPPHTTPHDSLMLSVPVPPQARLGDARDSVSRHKPHTQQLQPPPVKPEPPPGAPAVRKRVRFADSDDDNEADEDEDVPNTAAAPAPVAKLGKQSRAAPPSVRRTKGLARSAKCLKKCLMPTGTAGTTLVETSTAANTRGAGGLRKCQALNPQPVAHEGEEGEGDDVNDKSPGVRQEGEVVGQQTGRGGRAREYSEGGIRAAAGSVIGGGKRVGQGQGPRSGGSKRARRLPPQRRLQQGRGRRRRPRRKSDSEGGLVDSDDGLWFSYGSGGEDEGVTPGCNASGGETDGGDPDVWVQCEQCLAWRKLPAGTTVSESDPWFCHMHPDPNLSSCGAQRETAAADDVFDFAPGYMRPDEPPGSAANVDFFKTSLCSNREWRSEGYLQAARWLALQDPSALHPSGKGVRVPADVRRACPQYDNLFRTWDLAPEAGNRGSGGGARSRGSPAAACVRHTWRTRPYMRNLRFDAEGLSRALDALSSPSGHKTATAAGQATVRTFLSGATLVVLPPTLIDHWLGQIRTHVAAGTLRVCVLDRCNLRQPPSAAELAWEYDIVITTFNRLSFARASERGAGLSGLSQTILGVHWLRVILDEGHMLGASTTITNKLQMACRLRADRRWVMTGTPTPATSGSSAAHLQPLLAFLHHNPYGTNATTWQAAVQRPLEGCRPEGRRRLLQLLLQTMIRASKADLLLLPALHRRVTVLDFEPQHATSYNQLVEVVRRNLLTSDWCDDAHNESLLNPRNSRWSRQMMTNVWLSCCVAGSTNAEVKEEDLCETLQLLAGRLGVAAPGAGLPGGVAVGPPWLGPEHPLRRVEEGLRHGGQCEMCGELIRQPMVTPCGHLACLDCTARDREHCPLPTCRTPYVMQAADDAGRFKHNRHPKWPVPQELIEWQPVYHQRGARGLDAGSWSPTWQLTRSSKITHMLSRLREIGAAVAPGSEEHREQQHTSRGDQPGAGGGTGDEAGCSGGDGGGDQLSEGAEEAEAGPAAAAPQRERDATVTGGGRGATKRCQQSRRAPVRCKAIVFTQYGLHQQLIEASLMRAGLPFAILARALDDRAVQLSRFQHDPAVGVLVMDQVGAVGLDLSFVSYVLLMEPLEDTALEEQVVSRAHRMGATRPVMVETLVMRGTAEEALLRMDRKVPATTAPVTLTTIGKDCCCNHKNNTSTLSTIAVVESPTLVGGEAARAADASLRFDDVTTTGSGSGAIRMSYQTCHEKNHDHHRNEQNRYSNDRSNGHMAGIASSTNGGRAGHAIGAAATTASLAGVHAGDAGGRLSPIARMAAAELAAPAADVAGDASRVVGAADYEGGVQVDRRALRNQLFMLLEKVRLGPGGNDAGRGGSGGPGLPVNRVNRFGSGVSAAYTNN